MGQACKKLIVLFNPGKRYSSIDLSACKFIAEHEAFHIGMHRYGQKIPYSLIFSKGRALRLDSDKLKIVKILVTDATASAGERSLKDFCRNISGAFDRLDPRQKLDVKYYADLEWPAEYYTFLSVFGRSHRSEYETVRHHLGYFREYSASIPVLKKPIERIGSHVRSGREKARSISTPGSIHAPNRCGASKNSG
jgi:hypothetical protein